MRFMYLFLQNAQKPTLTAHAEVSSNTLAYLYFCTGWHEPLLLENMINTEISCAGTVQIYGSK